MTLYLDIYHHLLDNIEGWVYVVEEILFGTNAPLLLDGPDLCPPLDLLLRGGGRASIATEHDHKLYIGHHVELDPVRPTLRALSYCCVVDLLSPPRTSRRQILSWTKALK